MFMVFVNFALTMNSFFFDEEERKKFLDPFLWNLRAFTLQIPLFFLAKCVLFIPIKLLTVCCPSGRELTDTMSEYDDRVISVNYFDNKTSEFQNWLNGGALREGEGASDNQPEPNDDARFEEIRRAASA